MNETVSDTPESIIRLRAHLAPVTDLNGAAALLSWDQETYMPPGGVEARARQLATLGRLAHQRFTDAATGRALEEAEGDLDGLDPDGDAARLVAVARRDYDKATRLPSDLVAEIAATTAHAQVAWRAAREAGDWERFRPHLDKVLDLTLRKADALGWDETPYDALLDEYEPEMRTARVREIFAAVRARLVPLVAAIADARRPDDACLHRHFDADRQWTFGLDVVRDFGFDFERGRQDRSTHPFSTSFSVNDVRITTRVDERFLPTCLFGTLHEAGHAMYEQNVDPALEGTLLASGTSLGVHESQSRLWENLVGRSRVFWERYWPRLREAFPGALSGVDLDTFHRAINLVEPTPVRVEADEVTYNLHVMVRFELEILLVEGKLSTAQLPEAWNERMREYLGIVPEGVAEGALQDIHWSLGAIGYFPTYSLGNLISSQLWEAAGAELGDLDALVEAGEYERLLGWLREHVLRHGRKFTAGELLERVCGGPLDAEPWLRYAERKFGALYEL